jgi:hypothetical protein
MRWVTDEGQQTIAMWRSDDRSSHAELFAESRSLEDYPPDLRAEVEAAEAKALA